MPEDIFEKYEKRKPLPEGEGQSAKAEVPEREVIEPRGKIGEDLKKDISALKETAEESPRPLRGKEWGEERKEYADAVVEKLVAFAKIKGEQTALREAEGLDKYILDKVFDRLKQERSNQPEQ